MDLFYFIKGMTLKSTEKAVYYTLDINIIYANLK